MKHAIDKTIYMPDQIHKGPYFALLLKVCLVEGHGCGWGEGDGDHVDSWHHNLQSSQRNTVSY